MASKLFNARHELFAIMSFCKDLPTTGKMLLAIKDVDFFATQWAREAFTRIIERYKNMEVSEGVLKFTSLIADDHLSEDTKERLESGRKKFLNESFDIDEIIDSLKFYRKLRRLNELSEHINLALREGDVPDPDQILADAEEHIASTRSGNTNSANWFHHIGTEFNMQPVLERLMSDTVRSYVPTGVAAFDDANGGINYGALMTIAGSTGGGKSLVAQNVATHMAMYEDVCLVPLEMTEDEAVARMMAKEGRVPVHKITGKKWTEKEKDAALEGYRRFHKRVKKQGNKFSIWRPEEDVTIEQVFAAINPYNYRVIVIDYISLLSGADGEDSWQQLGRIARYAKMYAASQNKIVILLAQLSEEGKVRYARSILEHSNNAWIFVATEHTKEQGIIDVKQPKARNQDPSPFTLDVEYQFMSVTGSDTGNIVADDADEDEDKPSRSKGKVSKGDAASGSKKKGAKGKSYFDGVGDL